MRKRRTIGLVYRHRSLISDHEVKCKKLKRRNIQGSDFDAISSVGKLYLKTKQISGVRENSIKLFVRIKHPGRVLVVLGIEEYNRDVSK